MLVINFWRGSLEHKGVEFISYRTFCMILNCCLYVVMVLNECMSTENNSDDTRVGFIGN